MPFSVYRHLLCLAIVGVGITNIYAQVSQPLAPGSRLQVEHCQRVDMEVIPSGRMQVVAVPSSEAKVMGYTDTPIPADVAIPSNMQYWLECVEQGAAYVAEHPEIQLGSNSAQRATSKVIHPLLGRIEWDQSDPYNRLCPPGTPVGCVATAMAQVMLYWKHPNQGTGSHTWRWDGTTHTVNFDSVTYNWDLMLPKYGRSAHATPEQEAEAAKLSYHCGVSIDMMWQSGGSGTYNEHIPNALRDYFDYNERAATV
ncbi:MAG: C10 family peptidase, partial [Bacteroidales bacterium]|nr:C10 family peptidase [Bacteroidales bacterium]